MSRTDAAAVTGFPLSMANRLEQHRGVWVRAGQGAGPEFGYSDGTAHEAYLRQVLAEAVDLSSLSDELESRIRDWPSEYHLSSKRANLLRGFDLSGLTTVLELGCGCGAISRYLGEAGLAVDAIEGSPVRAALAASRCRDLAGVNVVNCNFNDIRLPAQGYDAVFLIGVLEYASRFSQQASDDRDAVRRILAAVRSTLRPGGLVFIAIENRLGLKYLLGAAEDHYGQPLVGVYDYPDGEGIRTYDLGQWQELIDQSGFGARRCCYPFPDYKVPEVVLAQGFVEREPRADSLLATIRSRDYLQELRANVDESALWSAVHQAGTVANFANSYLWVLSDDAAAIDRCVTFDFAHFGGGERRACYRTATVKPAGRDQVLKSHLHPACNEADAVLVRQVLEPAEYIRGERLSEIWSRIAASRPGLDAMAEPVSRYYRYLIDSSSQGIPLYDLLPQNIIVMDRGEYRAFDNEWQTVEPVSPEFVLYRALVNFCAQRQDRLGPLFDNGRFDSIEQFVLACARSVGVELGQSLYEFSRLDDRIQAQIHRSGAAASASLLRGRPGSGGESAFFHPRLYWAGVEADFDESRSQRLSAGIGRERQRLEFSVPGPVPAVQSLRFDPAEQEGFFHLYALSVVLEPAAGERQPVLDLQGAQQIMDAAESGSIVTGRGDLGSAWFASDADPRIVLRLPRSLTLGAGDRLMISVTMDWPQSPDYLLVRNEYARREQKLSAQIERMSAKLERLRTAETELGIIKGSRVWRVAERFRRAFYLGFLERFPFWQNLLLSVSRRGLRPTLARLRQLAASANRAGLGGRLRRVTGDVAAPQTDYERFVTTHFPGDDELRAMAAAVPGFARRPKISVLMPVYNAEPGVLRKAVESVLAQVYGNWELCIADDASTREDTVGYLKSLHHPRIRIRHLERNRNIAGASNAAAELADGEYLALLDNDDELTPHALFEVVRALNESDADIVYSDEDFIDIEGHYANPHFKPDFSPDLLLSHNYVTHLMVFRRDLFRRVGGFRGGYDGAQDYDLMLRMSEQANKIVHVPEVLYHWRMAAHSTSYDADAKPGALLASRAAIEDALRRRGVEAQVWNANMPHFYRVRPRLPAGNPELVSIIIPFRDRPELLRTCIGSILERSSYTDYEIIGVSNGSELLDTYALMRELAARDDRVRFIECNEPFNFSHLVNVGAEQARGSHLLLLNNDIEVISWDWIEAMLEQSQRAEVGVVGAKLFYPDNTIQHAGIIIGIGGYAGHAHKNFQAGRHGYFNRLHVIHNVSAVTGACMMVKAAVFHRVGGFDELHLGVACNDVDFCLRVREQGYWNIFTPHAELYHYESKSRGYEDTVAKKARFEREKDWFRQRHARVLEQGDPFYNPNLSLDAEDFRLRG